MWSTSACSTFLLQHGLILRKIQRGIKYHQRAWMAPYIAVKQEMREQAKTPFEKDVFKLMNNSVFGKTMENQKKRTYLSLVTNEQKFRQLVAKPQFMDARIYSENLCAVESQKTRLLIKKTLLRSVLCPGVGETPHVSVGSSHHFLFQYTSDLSISLFIFLHSRA